MKVFKRTSGNQTAVLKIYDECTSPINADDNLSFLLSLNRKTAIMTCYSNTVAGLVVKD